MRRTRDEGGRIALRLPAEMKLEAERLARLSGEPHVSDFYRKAIETYNEQVRRALEEPEPQPEPKPRTNADLGHRPGLGARRSG